MPYGIIAPVQMIKFLCEEYSHIRKSVTYQSINQSINQSVYLSIDKSINQPAKTINQPINQPTSQSELIYRPSISLLSYNASSRAVRRPRRRQFVGAAADFS